MPAPTLERVTFRTSRLLDFCSRKELIAQTGHREEAWPLVAVKELVDNALDACEDARVAPVINVTVDDDGIEASDNGSGLPVETLDGVLDFSVRVSNREAYVAPDRGAQGSALKTIVTMPFVLDGAAGQVEVTAHGRRDRITLAVDRIRQQPTIVRDNVVADVTTGTVVRLRRRAGCPNPGHGRQLVARHRQPVPPAGPVRPESRLGPRTAARRAPRAVGLADERTSSTATELREA
jgi:DNA topoisomerase VI subunit B